MGATWKFLRCAPTAAKIGMVIVLLNCFAAVFAPAIAPYGETEIVGAPWENGFWDAQAPEHTPPVVLGTDHIGRDLLTRVLFGARNTIGIALMTTTLAFAVGVSLGFLAASLRGWVDQLISRSFDVIMAIPTLIFALMILSVLGTEIHILIIVIALLDSTRVFRISRAVAMDVEIMEYVEVAKLRGEGLWWVMRREILPNTMAPLIAEFGLRFCFVFLFIAALSFLGLGIQPPSADWGSMVRENAQGITFGIIIPLIPAAAIALLTVGVNLVVDWFLQQASGIRDTR
ncbi:ABC transporter permease [Roseovarius arcticus]|uniref:ABC transporter permease n=1 Tax=Roseovarius arcticus TaxID=2547404 RepID=UPI00111076C1|nr:ABC transporter permease [Roseovarius arcticus]